MSTYHQIWIEQAGTPEVMHLRAASIAALGEGQVRVRVQAAGVTYADTLMRQGKTHPGSPKLPASPGSEIAGVIEAVGAGVNVLSVGQPVLAIVNSGGYAEQVVLEAWRCVPLPASVDPVKAAALPVNYWTAYHMLHRVAALKAGQRALIHGASGGVGTAIAQLGKQIGIEMVGTASPAKHDVVRAQGVTPIDYQREDFVERVLELMPGGVDAVFDPIGGQYWSRSYNTLGVGGTLVIYGGMGLKSIFPDSVPHVLRILFLALRLDGKHVRFVGMIPERMQGIYQQDMSELVRLLAEGQIDPVITATYPLAEAAEAHRTLETRRGAGKIVLIP